MTSGEVMVKANQPFLHYLLLSILVLPALVECSKSAASVVTSFKCINKGGNWQTIAQQGDKQSNVPFLNWNTTEFGNNYTPEKRCNMVSKKLTKAVINSGKSLSDLTLTSGTVNNSTVICVFPLNYKGSCNDQNMLFTLNQNNAKNPSQVLADIDAFAQGESKTINESGLPQFILLEDLVEKSMQEKVIW